MTFCKILINAELNKEETVTQMHNYTKIMCAINVFCYYKIPTSGLFVQFWKLKFEKNRNFHKSLTELTFFSSGSHINFFPLQRYQNEVTDYATFTKHTDRISLNFNQICVF